MISNFIETSSDLPAIWNKLVDMNSKGEETAMNTDNNKTTSTDNATFLLWQLTALSVLSAGSEK